MGSCSTTTTVLPFNVEVVYPEGSAPTIVPDPDVTLNIRYENVVTSLRLLATLFSATGSGEVHGSGELIIDISADGAASTANVDFVVPFSGGT